MNEKTKAFMDELNELVKKHGMAVEHARGETFIYDMTGNKPRGIGEIEFNKQEKKYVVVDYCE